MSLCEITIESSQIVNSVSLREADESQNGLPLHPPRPSWTEGRFRSVRWRRWKVFPLRPRPAVRRRDLVTQKRYSQKTHRRTAGRGDPRGRCRCTPDRVARYRSRISGPLLDRIDLALEVPAVDADLLAIRANAAAAERTSRGDSTPAVRAPEQESSVAVRARVVRARERQHARQGKANAHLTPSEIAQHCAPDAAGEALLRKAMARLALSARAYHRVLKVARTVADLAEARDVAVAHVAEAIGFRRADGT